MIRSAILTLTLLCAGPSFAQFVDPKGGDEAADGAASDCRALGASVRFCGSPPDFTLTPQTINSDLTSYFETPEGIQAATVIEEVGTADGLTMADVQNAALENLALAAGMPVSEVPVLSSGSVIIAGVPYPNFVYRGVVDGDMYVYSNSMILMENAVAQFVTIEQGVTTYSPRHQTVHFRFLEQVQVAR